MFRRPNTKPPPPISKEIHSIGAYVRVDPCSTSKGGVGYVTAVHTEERKVDVNYIANSIGISIHRNYMLLLLVLFFAMLHIFQMNKVVVKNYLPHNTMATKTTDIAAAGAAAREICPLETHVKSTATGLNFPIGFPQNLTFGRFHKAEASNLERGRPFITQDCWADMVDNRRTFLLRPFEVGMPSMERLQNWIRLRPHPITLVINNQKDISWPDDLSNKTNYELILNETNLHAVYAGNARLLEDYPKLHPLPIGMKWNWQSTELFSENKVPLTVMYANNTSTTPEEVETLFRSEGRTPTVYYRHMMNSNSGTRNYIRDTPALRAVRHTIYPILKSTANTSLRVPGELELPEYYMELKKHRFLISPSGNGLDTHSTWEALLSGCIPIVPKSALDPIFEDLPVWLVENWEDVTDENVNKKMEELTAPDKKYKWEKLFVHYWEQEIYRGLCQ